MRQKVKQGSDKKKEEEGLSGFNSRPGKHLPDGEVGSVRIRGRFT